jgi:hypothetical protein
LVSDPFRAPVFLLSGDLHTLYTLALLVQDRAGGDALRSQCRRRGGERGEASERRP